MTPRITSVPISRRRFVQVCGAGAAGAVLNAVLPSSAKAAGTGPVPPYALRFTTPDGKDPGHKLMIVYMQGGLSNFDTFDPKANSPFKKIDTDADDIKFTEILQALTKYAPNFVVINNLQSNEADHDRGAALALTTRRDTIGGSFYSPAVYQNPFVDFAELLNRQASGEVGYVVLHQSTADEHGYNRDWVQPWSALKHNEPMTVYSPYNTNTGEFINRLNGSSVPLPRFKERTKLLDALDSQGHVLVGDSADRHNRAYRQARSLIDGKFRDSYDLSKEPLKIQEKYGKTKVGKQLLLARRMLEGEARVVVSNDGNYDNHLGLKKDMEPKIQNFAKALGAFIEDTKIRFDKKVFIAIITEFGRTPTFSDNGPNGPGRDHWPNAFGMVIICNDKNEIDGGRTIGHTNNSGEIVGGNALPSSLVADTMLSLLKIRRYEKRGEVVTGVGFPYIDIIRGKEIARGELR